MVSWGRTVLRIKRLGGLEGETLTWPGAERERSPEKVRLEFSDEIHTLSSSESTL